MREVERELNAPKQERGTDLQKLLTQIQENPELAAQLKAILNATYQERMALHKMT